jgi:hypothetical protein
LAKIAIFLLSIRCFGERRYGGVLDDGLMMALPPSFLTKAIEGMKRLSADGLGYLIPVVRHPSNPTPRAGLPLSYGSKERC